LIRWIIHDYRELSAVVVAAAVGLTLQRPVLALVRHDGIDIFLIVLVYATAITIEPARLRALPAAWRPLLAALVVGASVLPALSWAVAHLIGPGSLRDGVITIGLAPCEIASIATTGMAGGDVALAGGVLIGSTILTVSVAGPLLGLEASHVSIHPGHIVINLLFVVAAPLCAGLATRLFLSLPAVAETIASSVSTLAVAILVALIAAEVNFSTQYLPVIAAILIFLVGSAALGHGLGLRQPPGLRRALLLTTSMRDFAIAAGLATAAFGASAAAPLGVYGIIVIVWGTASAGFLRTRDP
jgi:predicted Na+-dependent transporter